MGWPYEHMYLDPYFTAYRKTKSTLIVFLNAKGKTIKLLESNIGHLPKFRMGKDF